MMRFGADRPRRRPNLTPMIDVVFLLLVFFMLASRFGTDLALPLSVASSGAAYSGPPRLVDLSAESLRLNGTAIDPNDLAEALRALTDSPADAIILRAGEGADVQALVALMGRLSAAGFTRLVLVD